MKTLILAMLLLASLTTQALPIGSNGGTIIKVDWNGRATSNEYINWRGGPGSSSGGISEFKLRDDVAKGIVAQDAIDLGFGWLTDTDFYAMSLELERAIANPAYFEIVPLKFAPTFPDKMSQQTVDKLEQIVTAGGWELMDDLVGNRTDVTMLQMATWEASQDDGYDRMNGNFQEVFSLDLEANYNIRSLESFSGDSLVTGYGLLSVKMRNGNWVDARRQDFFVFEQSPVDIEQPPAETVTIPGPSPLALLGLGMIGMVGARKLRK